MHSKYTQVTKPNNVYGSFGPKNSAYVVIFEVRFELSNPKNMENYLFFKTIGSVFDFDYKDLFRDMLVRNANNVDSFH